jgi:septal ring factor EnvC (AmiA/AmiB activator)
MKKKLINNTYYIYWLLSILSCVQIGIAQHRTSDKRTEMEQQRKKLEQEVRLTKKLITQTRHHRKRSITELSLVRKQLQLREGIVKSIAEELNMLAAEITETEKIIAAMQQDIIRLQTGYAKVAHVAAKNQYNISILLWLLSAESFTEAYKRMGYFREFSRFRQSQIFLLKRTREYLQQKLAELAQKYAEKNQLQGKQSEESKLLAQTEKQKDQTYRELIRQESQYAHKLRIRQQQLRQLTREMDKIVNETVAEDKREALQGGHSVRTESDMLPALSGQFERNQGRLPWPMPISQGIVTAGFGRSEDASGGVIDNHGIYITTAAGQSIRAVFNGKVTKIGNVPEFGKVVIIRHGSYLTVYANLASVAVSLHQEVDALTPIGTVRTNSNGETQLHFMIYKDSKPLDPASWLVRK